MTIEAYVGHRNERYSFFSEMERLMRRISRFIANWFSIQSEEGVMATECGLIASLIAAVIIAAVAALARISKDCSITSATRSSSRDRIVSSEMPWAHGYDGIERTANQRRSEAEIQHPITFVLKMAE